MDGRLEALRPATVASKACAEAFDPSHPAGVDEMKQKFREACDVHASLIKRGAAGTYIVLYVVFIARNMYVST